MTNLLEPPETLLPENSQAQSALDAGNDPAQVAAEHPTCSTAWAQDSRKATDETYRDIQATLGVVPGFFRAYPEAGLSGAWAAFMQVQVAENTALNPKVKQLIGLAVSAQVDAQSLSSSFGLSST